jgi:hypothetical protein
MPAPTITDESRLPLYLSTRNLLELELEVALRLADIRTWYSDRDRKHQD